MKPPPMPYNPMLVVPLKNPLERPDKSAEPTPEQDPHAGLPIIRVMPRTIEDIQKQDRASVIQFS